MKVMNKKSIHQPSQLDQPGDMSDFKLSSLLENVLLVLVTLLVIFVSDKSLAAEEDDVARGLLQKNKTSQNVNVESKQQNVKQNRSQVNKKLVNKNTKSSQTLMIEGVAFSKTQMDADMQARKALQEKLREHVKLSTNACKEINVKYMSLCNNNRKKIITQDKLPLMGVNFQKITGKFGLKGSKASLVPHLSLPAYQAAISNEMQEMAKMQIKEEARGIKKRRGKDYTTRMMRFYQMAVVAAALGDSQYLSKEFKLPGYMKQYDSKVIKVSSITDAVSQITRIFKVKSAYIYPPRPLESVEITSFGKMFYDELAKKMTNKMSKYQFGSESISGVYSMVNGEMLLSYQHYNKDYLLESRLTLHLDKNAIGKFRTAPMSADFDQIFVNQDIPKTGFQGQIATQMGNDDLLFRNGDTINLFVRLSKPGYFYIVGHINRPGGEYSYLVDINEGEGPGLFVMYVRPDQVNQVIDLGAFDVEAPYGVEYLQLVSATRDLKNKLPKYSYDKKLGYYVLDSSKGDVKAGIEEVRALTRVDKTIYYHESQLAYTTME